LVLNEEVLERARKLGRNVAEAMKKPIEEVKWMGDEPGTCPVCHSNLLTVGKKNPVECPVCGIRGELKIKDGEIIVTFSEEEKEHSRLNIQGLKDHWDELTAAYGTSMATLMQKSDEVEKRRKKYIGYREIKKPKRRTT